MHPETRGRKIASEANMPSQYSSMQLIKLLIQVGKYRSSMHAILKKNFTFFFFFYLLSSPQVEVERKRANIVIFPFVGNETAVPGNLRDQLDGSRRRSEFIRRVKIHVCGICIDRFISPFYLLNRCKSASPCMPKKRN